MKIESCRSSRGQGIIEGVVGTWLLTTVLVLALLLLLNTYVASMYSLTLNNIAINVAQYAASQKTWLGMVRPDYTSSGTEAECRHLAEIMLSKTGLGALTDFTLTQEEVNDASIDGTVTVTKVSLRVDHLQTVGGVFPFYSLTACGTSAEASVPPYGVMSLAIVNEKDYTKHKIAQFPCYGVFTAVDHGGTSEATWTKHSAFPTGDYLTPTKFCGIGVREVDISSCPDYGKGASVQVISKTGEATGYGW